MIDAREQELIHRINLLVASSVATHRILQTPSQAMSLEQSATRVMAELGRLRTAVQGSAGQPSAPVVPSQDSSVTVDCQ